MKINDHNGLFRPEYLCRHCFTPVMYHGFGEGTAHESGRWPGDNGYYCNEFNTASVDEISFQGRWVKFDFSESDTVKPGSVVKVDGLYEPYVAISVDNNISKNPWFTCIPITQFFGPVTKKYWRKFSSTNLEVIANVLNWREYDKISI